MPHKQSDDVSLSPDKRTKLVCQVLALVVSRTYDALTNVGNSALIVPYPSDSQRPFPSQYGEYIKSDFPLALCLHSKLVGTMWMALWYPPACATESRISAFVTRYTVPVRSALTYPCSKITKDSEIPCQRPVYNRSSNKAL